MNSLNEGKSGFNKETSYAMSAGRIPLPFAAQLHTVYDLSPPLTPSLISCSWLQLVGGNVSTSLSNHSSEDFTMNWMLPIGLWPGDSEDRHKQALLVTELS